MGNKKLRETMTRFFKNFGFNLVFRPQERTFEIQKQIGDTVFSYPYILTSDTLQTIIFHVISMESNKNSTLVFEEPKVHAFPYYYQTKVKSLSSEQMSELMEYDPFFNLNSFIEQADKE